MTFVPGVETPEIPRTDPYIDLIDRAEKLGMSLVRLIPEQCPDDSGLMVEGGCGRISAGDVRGLIRACIRARKVLR